MAGLRLVFMGTPEFAVPVAQGLAESGHELVCIYTQPPRRAGRRRKTVPSPVQAFAEERGVPVRTPTDLKNTAEQDAFAALEPDAAVVAAYGLMLPRGILTAPGLGCLNVHPSLLPRWRGAAPVQRTILAGDRETGVSIMVMDEGLDTGPIVLQRAVPVAPDATGGLLEAELARVGARLAVEALEGLESGRLTPRPQPGEGATYAPKLSAEEERLDWNQPATELERKIRAFAPTPGAWFPHAGERIRVLAAELADEATAVYQPPAPSVAPGTVLGSHLTVACGDGALRLTFVQRAGRKAMRAEEFLRGWPIPPGTVLGHD